MKVQFFGDKVKIYTDNGSVTDNGSITVPFDLYLEMWKNS